MADVRRATQERHRYTSLTDQRAYTDYLMGALTYHVTAEQLESALASAHSCMYREMSNRSEHPYNNEVAE